MLGRIWRRSYVRLVCIILLPTFCLVLWIYSRKQIVYDLTKQISCDTSHGKISCNNASDGIKEEAQSDSSRQANIAYHLRSRNAWNDKSMAEKRDYIANFVRMNPSVLIRRGKYQIRGLPSRTSGENRDF